ncbi:MAG: [FeFe] hydrogenase H-cluster radical SAM maturase HydG [Elusimicrobiota bacterium]|jgi:2-iminoacetate synthase
MSIDHGRIVEELKETSKPDPARVREVLAKARELKGLDLPDVAVLMRTTDRELVHACYETARFVKREIYGNRIVYFAPLYVSNLCKNDCAYCAFRAENRGLKRKALSKDEILRETESLIEQGHKRVLLVSGEDYPEGGLQYVFDAIDAIYSVRTPKGSIRRVNVNIAPLTLPEFQRLNEHKIGTYQIFQETYHEVSYRGLHPRGPKADYRYRLETVGRAFEAGIADVGVGVLFGLYDWRYEVLALLGHVRALEKSHGLGPHTISVPRIEPAEGSALSARPPYAVTDAEFKKIIAIFRMAVPYTGIILSTRESIPMRRAALDLGVSQISAGSRTAPGGYGEGGSGAQFSLGDTRPLNEVVYDVLKMGHIPSFCTGCYRRGRVGKDFMDLAKPGLIKQHCLPNAMLTFAEYLYDFADPDLSQKGFDVIRVMLEREVVSEPLRVKVGELLRRVRNGERDLYL